MIIEDALRKIIVDAATTAMDRVYPLLLPPTPGFPAVAYVRVSTRRVHCLTGFSHLAIPRFQFTAWAKTYGEAHVLANELRVAMDGYTGWLAAAFPLPFPIGWVQIQSCWSENELDLYEPKPGLYGVPADYMVAHQE